jgi:acetyl-CoA carboxylase biotin carboxyl carrier protein
MNNQRIVSSNGYGEEIAPGMSGNGQAAIMDIDQIQKLVHLLDQSDISEVELNQTDQGRRLALRKFKIAEDPVQIDELISADNNLPSSGELIATPNQQHHHHITAPMVGIFHPWLKPHGEDLIAIGNQVEEGQIIGAIEALNILNEIEATVAGRVVEIHVHDSQPVEYGQILITIDGSDPH